MSFKDTETSAAPHTVSVLPKLPSAESMQHIRLEVLEMAVNLPGPSTPAQILERAKMFENYVMAGLVPSTFTPEVAPTPLQKEWDRVTGSKTTYPVKGGDDAA
jgi:hypothetical protein